MTFLVVILAFSILLALMIQPKVGAYLVWPIVFLYPHLYMERLGLLPWNIGGDDLFICLFFLIVVVRRNLLGRVPLRLGISVIGAVAYLVIWTVANFSGWSLVPELEPEQIYKPILKYVVFVLLTYSLVHTLDDARDLRRVSIAFCVTLTLAGVTVILQRWFPEPMRIFTTEREEMTRLALGGVERAIGSLLNPNTACSLLGMVVVMAVCLSGSLPAGAAKVALLGCIPVLLAAMVFTESRAGALSLSLSLLAMLLFSRYRRYAWVMGGGLVVAVLLKPDVFLPYWERIVSTYNPVAGQLGETAMSRVDIWKRFWETSTPQIWLLGQGRIAAHYRIGADAHSTYVGALFHHGIAGVVWFLVFFGILVRRGWWLVHHAPQPYRMVASGVMWGLLLWAIAGLTIDMVVTAPSRFVYLFYAVLLERGYVLARRRAAPVSLPERLTPYGRPAYAPLRMPPAG
ncbi:MAG: hypothetical protein D6788_00890 [Planctomycetota bacterium]|nr:MAG: hypothetical protein D6788_00890 [Planctomycetota bacterium]